MTERHTCLRAILLAGLAGLTVMACSGEPETRQVSTLLAREANETFDQLAREELAARPELVTRLGIKQAHALARLNDRSQAGFERARLRRIEALEALKAMPLAPAGSDLRRDQVALLDVYTQLVRLGGFGHGRVSHGLARPYVIDHISGGWREVPELLITRQPVGDRGEALAYLERLSQLAGTLDDERRRLVAEAEAGIVPPDIILQEASERIAAMGAIDAAAHPLLITFEDLLTGAPDLSGEERIELHEAAGRILRADTIPAYQTLAQTMERLREGASDIPGVWALSDGDAYYDGLLTLYTHSGANAESLHREGRALVEALTREVDAQLREEGLIEGAVGTRLARLAARDDQIFSDDAEGHRALMAELDRLSAQAQRKLGGWIAHMPDRPVVISPLPGAVDDRAGHAVYRPPTADGSHPGTLYISVSDTSLWPRFSLPALIHHETIPGHHTESAFTIANARQPLLRRLTWPTGYGEGWATYAELVAYEAGLHEGDRLAEIGYLQSQLLRAARAVTDTGLHRMRWSRQEAIDYMVAVTGMPQAQMASEVDRMTVWPGQATSYMAGQQFILRIRERARGVLGDDFDIAAFHHTLLSAGPRPLELLQRDLESWYEAQLHGLN